MKTETSIALQAPHTFWGAGEQRSGERVARGLHKQFAGTGCHQEAMTLGQARALCEDAEVPSRGETERIVVGGLELESHCSSGRFP